MVGDTHYRDSRESADITVQSAYFEALLCSAGVVVAVGVVVSSSFGVDSFKVTSSPSAAAAAAVTLVVACDGRTSFLSATSSLRPGSPAAVSRPSHVSSSPTSNMGLVAGLADDPSDTVVAAATQSLTSADNGHRHTTQHTDCYQKK